MSPVEYRWETETTATPHLGQWFPWTIESEMYISRVTLNRWERVSIRYDNGQLCTFKRRPVQ